MMNISKRYAFIGFAVFLNVLCGHLTLTPMLPYRPYLIAEAVDALGIVTTVNSCMP